MFPLKTGDVDSNVVQCWANVVDHAPALKRLMLLVKQLLSFVLLHKARTYTRFYRSGPLGSSSGHMYPESTTEIEATWVQLKPETYIDWSIALPS